MIGMSVALVATLGAPAPELQWDAPDGCPDAADVEQAIDRLLGSRHEAESPVLARAHVTGEPGNWTLELYVETEQGKTERTLRSQQCSTLRDATALYVALSVDPMAVLDADTELAEVEVVETDQASKEQSNTDDPDAEMDSAAEDGTEPESTEPDERSGYERPPRERRTRDALSLRLRAFGSGQLAILPGPTGGAGLGVSVRLTRLRLEATGTYGFRYRARSEQVPDVGADVRHGYAELRACPYGMVSTVELGGCAGLAVGGLDARGVAVRSQQVARTPWVSASLGFVLAWHVVPRVALWVEPGAILSLHRARYTVDGLGEVFRLGVIGGRATLGVEVALW